jgi:hypothetical protein
MRELYRFTGPLAAGDVLRARPVFPWRGIRYVRVVSLSSEPWSDWVAWNEIEVLSP